MAKKIEKLTDIAPQRANANRHTARGLGMLEASIQADGWIGAITVAADGETFDGSARVETGASAGFAEVEPIIVRSRGDRPIIHVREDIPSAADPRARRLGVAANRVAELNLSWEPGVLAEMRDDPEVALGALFTAEEMADVAMAVPDVEFKEYTEEVENDVKYCTCPNCGHKFPQ